MFVGHFALAYAAKRVSPRASLGTLFAAAQLPALSDVMSEAIREVWPRWTPKPGH